MRPIPTPDSLEHATYPQTTLRPEHLVEIGRVIAHHGLLVSSAREFVEFVATEAPGFPISIGSEDSIKLLPQAVHVIKLALPPSERKRLTELMDQLASVQQLLDQFRYSTWGSGGNAARRHEYRQYKGFGCCGDCTDFTAGDLYNLAMEISSVTLSVRKIHGLLHNHILDEPAKVRRQLTRFPRARTSALRD
jgi:hypothetical protein